MEMADLSIAKDVAHLVDVAGAQGEEALHRVFRGGM